MKVCCVSDLHGNLPDVPDCDLLLLGGDLCRNHDDHKWYGGTLKPWVDATAKRCKVVAVAGNHDFVFQRKPDAVPAMDWSYLQDSGIEWGGLKIWGSPWQPRFHDWAFNADEPELEKVWAKIPDDTDILLLHGPPHGYGDKSEYKWKTDDDTAWPGYEHTGSPSLLKRIEEVKPKLAVAGHIHSGYGVYRIGPTVFVSASLVNNRYVPVNLPVVVEL